MKNLHLRRGFGGPAKQERTVVLIKPDGVKRGLIGEVISRIEKRGLKIIALSMISPTRKQIDEHYPKDLAWVKRLGEKSLATYAKYGWDAKKEMGTDDPMKIGKSVRGWILDFMTSGPSVKIVVEGIHAVEMVRKLVGNSIPALAEMGTIRGDFTIDSYEISDIDSRAVRNLIHASGSVAEAEKEILIWFKDEEIFSYKLIQESILYDVNLDGILE